MAINIQEILQKLIGIQPAKPIMTYPVNRQVASAPRPTPTPSPKAVMYPASTPVVNQKRLPMKVISTVQVNQPAFDFATFAQEAKPIFQKYGIPPQVGFGMAAAENSVGPGRVPGKFALQRNNFYNINAVDASPGSASSFPTTTAGVEAWAKLLSSDPRYQSAYAFRTNPEQMLRAIEQAGYAGDPRTYQQRSRTSGGQGTFKTYSDFVMNTPEWRNALTY